MRQWRGACRSLKLSRRHHMTKAGDHTMAAQGHNGWPIQMRGGTWRSVHTATGRHRFICGSSAFAVVIVAVIKQPGQVLARATGVRFADAEKQFTHKHETEVLATSIGLW